MGSKLEGPRLELPGLQFSATGETYRQEPAGDEASAPYLHTDITVSLTDRPNPVLVQVEEFTSAKKPYAEVWVGGHEVSARCFKYDTAQRKVTIFTEQTQCRAQLQASSETPNWSAIEKAVTQELGALNGFITAQHWRGFDLAVVGKTTRAQQLPQAVAYLQSVLPKGEPVALDVALGMIALAKYCPTLVAQARYFATITGASAEIVLGTIAREDKFVHDTNRRGGMGFFQWTRGEGRAHPFGAAWTEATRHPLFVINWGATNGGTLPSPQQASADLLAGSIRLGPEYDHYVSQKSDMTDRSIAARRVFHMRAATAAKAYLRGDVSGLDGLAKFEASLFPKWVRGISAALVWIDATAPQRFGKR